MSTEPIPVDYWHEFVPWLRIQPRERRPSLLQLCVQRYGPAPDELRPQIESALSEIEESA